MKAKTFVCGIEDRENFGRRPPLHHRSRCASINKSWKTTILHSWQCFGFQVRFISFMGRESIVRWTVSVFGLCTTLHFSHPKSMSLSFEKPSKWSSSWFYKKHIKKNHPQTRHQSFLTCRSMPDYSKSWHNSMVLLLPDGTTSKAVIFIVDVGKVYFGFWSNVFGLTSSLPSQREKESENNWTFLNLMSSHSSAPLFLRSPHINLDPRIFTPLRHWLQYKQEKNTSYMNRLNPDWLMSWPSLCISWQMYVFPRKIRE